MCSPWTRLERAALREAVTLTSGGGATKALREGHPRILGMERDEVQKARIDDDDSDGDDDDDGDDDRQPFSASALWLDVIRGHEMRRAVLYMHLKDFQLFTSKVQKKMFIFSSVVS